MINLSVYAAAKASAEKAQLLQKENRALRKASFEMCMAFECLEKISTEIKELQNKFGAANVTFICGTSHGSLYATKDFLTGLAKTNRARPFLFQNSLHNSITGFLCQQFNLKGPSFTISTGDSTGENCLDLAQDLITSGFTKTCVVLSVDGLVKGFNDILQSYVKTHSLTEGAGALIVSSEEALNSVPLSRISIEEQTAPTDVQPADFYYDSNCIEHIVNALETKTVLVNRHRPISKKLSKISLQFT